MTNYLVKRPSQQPIKCWGCEKYHMYKYFPHKGDWMRVVHKIEEATIVEDMDKNMSRINVALDNIQAKIEVRLIIIP
jgi:hypothetical protein